MLKQWRETRRFRQATRWHLCPPSTPKQFRRWKRWSSNAENKAAFDKVQRTIDICRASGVPRRPTWEELTLDAIWRRIRAITLWGSISVLLLFATIIFDIIITHIASK